MRQYIFKYFFPGIFLIGLAFWAGSQKTLLLALIGFLAFFTIGVTLIIEGNKKRLQQKQKDS